MHNRRVTQRVTALRERRRCSKARSNLTHCAPGAMSAGHEMLVAGQSRVHGSDGPVVPVGRSYGGVDQFAADLSPAQRGVMSSVVKPRRRSLISSTCCALI